MYTIDRIKERVKSMGDDLTELERRLRNKEIHRGDCIDAVRDLNEWTSTILEEIEK